MIQRIQSIFLLIVVFLSGLLFLIPFASFQKGVEVSPFTICGIPGTIIWPLILINIIILATALVTIFLYKNRILQIRLCTFNIVLEFGMYLLIAFYLYNLNCDEIQMTLKFPITFPFVNLVLNYLALRAIGKDEALIHSMEHLR